MLAEGDVAAAAKVLGRPHRVEGVVVRGHQRGRALGFPTANLETPPHTAIPADGIYAGWLASLDGEGRDSQRLASGDLDRHQSRRSATGDRTVEAYALDRNDLDLYGVHAAIDFGARLRGTLRFDSVDALVEQMRRTLTRARPRAYRVVRIEDQAGRWPRAWYRETLPAMTGRDVLHPHRGRPTGTFTARKA